MVRRGAQTGWGRGGRKWGLQSRQSVYRIFWYEVRLEEKNVHEAHMYLISHLEPYHDILVAPRETGMKTVTMYRTDGGVRLCDEGARAGLPLATAKV